MGYGNQIGQQGTARPVRPRAPLAPPRPDNRGGMLGAAPAFPSLASPGRARPAATAAAPAPMYTNDQVAQSLARNPQAAGTGGSLFAYQGPQAPPVNPAPVAPVAPNVSYDYNADPILAETRALSGRNRGDATSGALAAKKQLAIDYNDTALANQLGDPATAAAAAQNPFGVLEQLKRSYGQGAHNLDEQLNNQNLFYGSYRTQQQGNLAHDYQGQQASAAGQEQGLLGGIGDQLTAALNAADAADIGAQQDAANRAAANGLANGVDPGATVAGPAAPANDPITAALTDTSAPNVNPWPGAVGALIGANSTYTPPGNVDLAPARDASSALIPGFQAGSFGDTSPDPLAAALAQQNKRRLLQFG